MNWFHRLRLRAFGVTIACLLIAFILNVVVSAPVWPAVGVGLVTAAAIVNKMTARLSKPTCRECGTGLDVSQVGVYGVICQECGAVNDITPPRA